MRIGLTPWLRHLFPMFYYDMRHVDADHIPHPPLLRALFDIERMSPPPASPRMLRACAPRCWPRPLRCGENW